MRRSDSRAAPANLAILVVTALLCAFFVEAGFRIRGYLKESDLYEKKHRVEERLRNQGNLSYIGSGVKIRPSKYEGLFYELEPMQDSLHMGVRLRTNREGFRDSEYPVEKGTGTLRIFGIGDSVMFGQGVPQGDDYLSVLEVKLNRRYPGRRWEVINSGVPDYNTFAEVETLRHKGLKYRPDVVVLGICSNDFDLPGYVFYLGLPEPRETGRYFSPRHSFFIQFLRHRFGRAPLDIPGLSHTHLDRAGGKGVYRAMKELRRLASIEGFQVVVIHLAHRNNRNTKDLMKLSRALGFHVLDVSPDIQQYMKQNGISDYLGSRLAVEDGHPSSLTHRIAADSILGFMEQAEIVKALLDRTQ
jgi:hypothetical protein